MKANIADRRITEESGTDDPNAFLDAVAKMIAKVLFQDEQKKESLKRKAKKVCECNKS